MSYGTKMALPLSTPGFIAAVLAHPDFINKGYVWGQNANVHYCFMDPKRVRFDIWEKRFHWIALTALLANLAVALFALWWGNVPLAVKLFLCVPSMTVILLFHYQWTAKEQIAAVVTNGPQMQYPFGFDTAKMFATGISLLAIGGIAAAFLLKIKGGIPDLPIGKYTISGGFLHALLAIGGGINVACIGLFILGKMTVPFGWVVSPTVPVNDNRGNITGWFFLARNGTALINYRIAPGNPVGFPFGSGGLTPIIVNHTLTSFASSLSATPGSLLPAQLILWGVLPLTPEGESFYSETDIAEEILPPQDAAGLLFVVGSETYSSAIAIDLRRLGTTQAVATDGHLSPLLGTHNDLLISTYFALDPIQKYGFMAIPE